MKIAVAGTGYVGLSMATLLAQHNEVMAVDIVPAKVEMINNRKSPIQDDYDKYLLIQDQWLPKVIMSADQAERDANWAAFVAEITPYAEIYTEFMQAEVLKLVEQNTK